MIRIGVVDFDSSHSVEFTKRLNRRLIAEDQWVSGAEVVLGCSLPSAITPPEKVHEYERVFAEQLGVPLVSRPEEMIGRIDAVLIEAVDGSVHLERVRPFLAAGVPAFVDKPFACSLDDAREIVRLAGRKKTPLFSSSSLRYAPDVVRARAAEAEYGRLAGCDVYCPASLHPRNPGLFHYGIHGVETIYTLMGPGCREVHCVSTAGADLVTGVWRDGRIAILRGIRAGASGYGMTLFYQRRAVTQAIDTRFIYRELLREIVGMFQTGKQPLDPAETLEIVAFIDAARRSAEAGGTTREVAA